MDREWVEGAPVSKVAQAESGQGHESEIRGKLSRHREILDQSLRGLEDVSAALAAALELALGALRRGRTILLAGNGGSAAEAQHFAAELVGRFRRERPAYSALALTTDTSILTAIGNDYSFDDIFARQIEGIGRPGDLLIAFSTSGESENLLRAVDRCRKIGIKVVAVSGGRSGRLGEAADVNILVPAPDTATVQELHTLITHVLCDVIERELATGR